MKKILMPVIILFILASCLTAPEFPPTVNEGQVKKIADIEMKLTLMEPEDLDARHRARGKYFYDYPALMPRQRLVVIELEAVSGGEKIYIDTNKVRLDAKKRSYTAETRATYKDNWDRFVIDTEKAWFDRLIDQYLLPDRITIIPDRPVRGYFAFLLYDKDPTEWELVIPAYAANGDKGTISLDFTLEPYYKDKTEADNEGIFQEN
jgi:hypothetical protein